MAVKQVLHDKLFANLTIREAAKGFLLSRRSSGGIRPGSTKTLENALGLPATYAEEQGWPGVQTITTSLMEEYLAYLQVCPKWFGDRGDKGKLSQSHIEGQYRRIGRFFNWCVERGHRESNPLDLIPHPKIDEKTVATISDREVSNLLIFIGLERHGTLLASSKSGTLLLRRDQGDVAVL